MKLISWNVNGVRASADKGLLSFLDKERPDILCLQETKTHKDQLEEGLLKSLHRGGESYFMSAYKKGYSGVATLLSKKAPPVKKVHYGLGVRAYDKEGRVVVTEYEKFKLYNIYFPNGALGPDRHLFKQRFLKYLKGHLKKEMKKKPLIVVGDYNVAHEEVDVYDPVKLSTVSGFLPEERKWFQSFLETGFVDVFRHFYPKKQTFTWWSYRENARKFNRGWRIDMICVTKDFIGSVKKCKIFEKQRGSDHCPISVEI